MPEELRVGLVGCGGVAHNHASAYEAIDDVALVACCDVDPDRASAFAARYGADHAVQDLEALLDLGVDLVSVCTPHRNHEEVVLAAARRGVHVLCEKPIAVDLQAGIRMVRSCEEAEVTLGVLYQRRFWPAAARVRAAIDQGVLDTPVLGHASVLLHRDSSYYTNDPWRGRWATDGGGVLMTQAVHHLDLLQWYMGEVVEVSEHHATYKHGGVIEVEDTLVALLRFGGGGLATLSASTAVTPGLGARLQLTGRNGATVGFTEYPEGSAAVMDMWTVPGQLDVRSPYGPGLQADVPLSSINGGLAPFHAMQITDFVQAVRNGSEPAVSGREAVKSLGIISALYASAASGGPEAVPAETYLREASQ